MRPRHTQRAREACQSAGAAPPPADLHAWSSQTPPLQQDGAALATHRCSRPRLDRPTSRFQNAFGNRCSSSVRRRRRLIYRPPDSLATPLPVPGSSRTLRYQPEGAANAQLVRDLQQYGALAVIIGDGDEEPIGCVVDVRLAGGERRGPGGGGGVVHLVKRESLPGTIAKAFPRRGKYQPSKIPISSTPTTSWRPTTSSRRTSRRRRKLETTAWICWKRP